MLLICDISNKTCQQLYLRNVRVVQSPVLALQSFQDLKSSSLSVSHCCLKQGNSEARLGEGE